MTDQATQMFLRKITTQIRREMAFENCRSGPGGASRIGFEIAEYIRKEAQVYTRIKEMMEAETHDQTQ